MCGVYKHGIQKEPRGNPKESQKHPTGSLSGQLQGILKFHRGPRLLGCLWERILDHQLKGIGQRLLNVRTIRMQNVVHIYVHICFVIQVRL